MFFTELRFSNSCLMKKKDNDSDHRFGWTAWSNQISLSLKCQKDSFIKHTDCERKVDQESKYLFMNNNKQFIPKEKSRLQRLLKLNKNLSKVYNLKYFMRDLKKEKNLVYVHKAWEEWWSMADERNLKTSNNLWKFPKSMHRYSHLLFLITLYQLVGWDHEQNEGG